MADPNNISDIVNVKVNLLDGVASSAGFSDPRLISQFAATASFPDRFKVYSGSSNDIDTALANDGFLATDAQRRMALATTTQKAPPSKIVIARWDPADPSFTFALDAIQTELTDAGVDAYAIHSDPLVTSDFNVLEGYNWVLNKFGVFFGQTSSSSVLNNDPGNVALQGLALDSDRCVLLWHDAVTASKLGPAQLVSKTGTFNVTSGSDLNIRINGGVLQPFVFTSTSATVTGTNTEPFVFADGDSFAFSIDGAVAPQVVDFAVGPAELLSFQELYDIENGATLIIRTDGGSPQLVAFVGTSGAVETVGGQPFALADLETVTFAIDGGGNQVVTFNTADFAAIGAATADEIRLVYLAQLTGVNVVDDGSEVNVISARIGAATDVEIVAGTGGALVALGYGVGNNLGTGGVTAIPFLDVTTAVQAAAEIAALSTGLAASGATGAVFLTSDTIGTDGRLQVTGGTANAVFGFPINEVSGTGDFGDASAVSAAEVALKINNNSFGVLVSLTAGALTFTSLTAGNASEVNILGGTNAPTTLGFPIASTLGAGPFENTAAARADELSAFIGLTLVDGTVSTISNTTIISSLTSGSGAFIEVISGTAQTALGFPDSAIGIGTDEDYLMCRWLGARIAINLDATNGKALWDNVRINGGFADVLSKPQRDLLHGTLFTNTFENRNGREEFHRGSLLNDTKRYIDERTSADWGDARITEAIKVLLDNAADAGIAVPLTNPGIEQVAAQIIGVLQRGATANHWVFDDSEIDPLKANDTGITVPDVRDLTNEDIANRILTGFKIVLRLTGGVQGAVVRFDLTRVLADA